MNDMIKEEESVMMGEKLSRLQKKFTFKDEITVKSKTKNRIHFLATGNSDCILIESQGHFALVDAAEDSDNPRGFRTLAFKGYEDFIVDYIKTVAADTDGKVFLEWVLGTHAHSDHIGGFDTLINDPDVTVRKAYLKEYSEEYTNLYERRHWDNTEVYNQMVEACKANNVEIIQDLPTEEWKFYDFTVQFFNTELNRTKKTGENCNSVGTKLKIYSKSVFLAGDINNINKTEDKIGPVIGHVDILKLGHHGFPRSSTKNFLCNLTPEIAIATYAGKPGAINPIALNNLLNLGTAVYSTSEMNGMVFEFTPAQMIQVKNIHPTQA